MNESSAHERSETTLEQKLEFERLLAELSAAFVAVPSDQLDATIDNWLRRIVEYLDIDRSTIGEFSRDDGQIRVTHSWTRGGFAPLPMPLSENDLPWLAAMMHRGETVVFARLNDLPEEAWREKELMGRYGPKANVTVPLLVGTKLVGGLAFGSIRREREWPAWEVQRLQLVGQVFANALERKRAQEQIDELLSFERLVSQLSAAFINLPVEGIGREIETGLQRSTEILGIDRATIYRLLDSHTVLKAVHRYAAPGIPAAPAVIRREEFPDFFDRLLRGDPVAMAAPTEFADEGPEARRYVEEQGIRSSIMVPLLVGGAIQGVVGWVAIRASRDWPEALIQRLCLVGGIFANALERKRVEEALRKSESRFRRALEVAPEGVLLVRTDGAIVFANEQAGRTFGYTPEELTGLHVDELVPGRFRIAHTQQRQEFLRSGSFREIGARQNLSGLRKDGSEVLVEIGLSPLETAEGQMVYCGVRDVTELRRSEDERRALRAQVWHADRVARTGALTASLAHELNQPLAAILSNAQAGLRFLARANPDLQEIREILNDIVRDDKRAGGVIGSLRSMLNRQVVERERIDLTGTLREMLDLLRSELLTNQVEVDTDFESGCTVLVDKAQLQQVVLNLATNAIEAMRERPAGERRLGLAVSRAGEGEVRVAVRDAGAGIPKERLPKVFDAFWTTKDQGMGLGLAICRSIVESCGGTIGIEPNDDRGVTFFFRLPAAWTDGIEQQPPRPGEKRD
ncbi:MAG: ATP-binding protein [Candidatus Methylomirabilales bacterium]